MLLAHFALTGKVCLIVEQDLFYRVAQQTENMRFFIASVTFLSVLRSIHCVHHLLCDLVIDRMSNVKKKYIFTYVYVNMKYSLCVSMMT